MSTTLITFSWLKCLSRRTSLTILLASTRSSNAPGIFLIATLEEQPCRTESHQQLAMYGIKHGP